MKKTMFEINFFQYKILNWDNKKLKILELIELNLKKHKHPLDLIQTQKTSFASKDFDAYDIISEDINQFAQEIDCEVIFLDHWYQIYKKNDFHSIHHHTVSPNLYSGIIFVKYKEEVHKSTSFVNPLYWSTGQPKNYSPKVEEGNMIIFPSDLLHEAPINTSNIERVVVSFNLKINPSSNINHQLVNKQYEEKIQIDILEKFKYN